MKADLHIHSTASDGKLSPQAILDQAAATGLSTIALTDHDTVDGLLALRKLPANQAVTLIPGIEFSTDLPANEVHILGYYIDITHPELTSQLQLLADDRLARANRMVNKLNDLGYYISYDQVLEIAGDAASIGRPHVAAALLEAGYFDSMQDVFSKLLAKNSPAYVPHYKLTPQKTIELIKSAGGIPVLAHPGLVESDQIVIDIISLGIQGIEVYHPKHSSDQTAKYLQLATERHLIVTGGSDFHGLSGRFPEQLGEFYIPDQLVVLLQQMSMHERSQSRI
jgi:hypothetical protein